MHIALGSDHGGFAYKEHLITVLTQAGYDVVDFGTHSEDSCDYPDYAKPVASAVAASDVDFGILICGTGLGMAIAADKVEGVRAVNITSVPFARLAREHNNANVLTLSGRFVSESDNDAIVEAFLNTAFEGGRHERRVEKIMDLD